MGKKDSDFVLKIRKRPWYIWFLRLIWLAWLVLWVEVAIGSWQEFEPKASAIALIVFLISLFFGFLLWLNGYRKDKERKKSWISR